ncbi:hypothetical protein CI15_26540 [Paraburkholderia monticola]|uniref:Acyl-CoA dehydrogenase n=2 Tax=Paraburkholderia monticola TaxID=1399968 RepID=A0A149PG97_9BURK|nr:hypothetical protein CI15_26540 [Paraburkholderia monticola]
MTSIVELMLSDIKGMASTIVARLPEIDALRSMPRDVIETLRSIGIFRSLVPRRYGGLELDVPAALEIVTALGRIDGSLGWISMIGATAALVAPELPQSTYERIYANGPDVIFAGSFAPGGTADRTDRGWCVNGRWPFASGCAHADWILGLSTMREGSTPLSAPSGEVPLMRAFLLPADQWHIEDSWHVMGLVGTGSHHISLRNALVTEDHFFAPAEQRWLEGPLYSVVPPFIPLFHAANMLGIAEGALADLIALAASGHRQYRAATSMRDSEWFQAELGRIDADLRAARALLRDQAASHWRHAVDGTLSEKDLHVHGTQVATWMAATCVRVADACFSLAGSGALYRDSPLQRRMRDLHGAAQHAAVQQRNFISGGGLLLQQA